MPKKRCEMCGGIMDIPDWYAYISTKYCKSCAAESTRENKRAWAREFRRKNRAKNQAMRELCKAQKENIDALRAEIVRLRNETRMLKEGR